jgi:hypothetical protein
MLLASLDSIEVSFQHFQYYPDQAKLTIVHYTLN